VVIKCVLANVEPQSRKTSLLPHFKSQKSAKTRLLLNIN